ncbi:potassium channel family protein [Blastococcus sp. SYSU D01042]
MVAVLLALAAYYLVPISGSTVEPTTLVRAGATVAVLGLAVWSVGREVLRAARSRDPGARLGRLLVALVGGVLVFALVDHTVAHAGEGQFVGLETRTDALYFSLATLTTVGFGDVHAAGQLARLVVSTQMIFNVVVLATAAQILWQGLARRRKGEER